MNLRSKCDLTGVDGNVFSLLGAATKALKRDGQFFEAGEMQNRVMSSDSYDQAFSIILEYVDDSYIECDDEE